MPRALNVALAAFFLLFLVPSVVVFSGLPTLGQAVVLLIGPPFALLTFLCLCSAARPGSLGRWARRTKARRAARQRPDGRGARRGRPSPEQVAGEPGSEQGDLGTPAG